MKFKRIISLILILLLLTATLAMGADLTPYPRFRVYDTTTGVPLSSGKVYWFETGTSTPKDTYTDSAAGTANANPVILDSAGEADIWLDGEYRIRVDDSADNVIMGLIDNVTGKLGLKTIDQRRYAADAQSNDTYVITLSPAPSAYYNGMLINFKANTANTGAATINANALGAIDIKKNHDQTLQDGDIEANQIVTLVYNSSTAKFQMVSHVGILSATTSLIGQVELATGTEANTLTSTTLAITPNALSAVAATTSKVGLVEMATSSEVLALSSATLAVSPQSLSPLFYSVFQRAQFVYSDADQITIEAAAYFVKDKLAQWVSTITTTAISSPIPNTWYHYYLDYSAITSGTAITNLEISASTLTPSFNTTYRQQMRGDDRLIFSVRTDVSSNILEFIHSGNHTTWADYIQEASAIDYDLTFLDVDIASSVPVFATRATMTIQANFNTTGANALWRTNGQTGSVGKLIGNATSDTAAGINVFDVVTDSAQIFELVHSASNATNSSLWTLGWYLPEGM